MIYSDMHSSKYVLFSSNLHFVLHHTAKYSSGQFLSGCEPIVRNIERLRLQNYLISNRYWVKLLETHDDTEPPFLPFSAPLVTMAQQETAHSKGMIEDCWIKGLLTKDRQLREITKEWSTQGRTTTWSKENNHWTPRKGSTNANCGLRGGTKEINTPISFSFRSPFDSFHWPSQPKVER